MFNRPDSDPICTRRPTAQPTDPMSSPLPEAAHDGEAGTFRRQAAATTLRDPMNRSPCPPGSARLLAEVAAGVATGSDVEALLSQLLEPLARLAGASAGLVRTLRTDQRLHLVSSVGLGRSVACTEASVDAHCGHCGQAVSADRVIPVRDGSGACRRPAQDAYMLGVPLSHREQVLGVYNFYFSADLPSQDVQDLLLAVGKLLGLALAKERLEAETLKAALLHERQMLAAEVHDSIAQSLSFVKMRLPLLRDAIDTGQAAATTRYFDDVRSGLGQAHASLRSVLTEFRAPMDRQGLLPALRASADLFRHRSGTELSLHSVITDEQCAGLLDAQHEAQVFHIVQEALNNIERHAGAQHAWITLALEAGGAGLHVAIEDDGSGLRESPLDDLPATGSSHYGLAIMVERARRIRASLSIGPRPGGGTAVQLHVPLPGQRDGGPARAVPGAAAAATPAALGNPA
jgi:two-component system nitrate/nitrite sensor histidine kinase NarX